MSEAKFTPGPLCTGDKMSGERVAAYLGAYASGPGQCDAPSHPCCHEVFTADVRGDALDAVSLAICETEEDATLYASAPDLYEACKAARRRIREINAQYDMYNTDVLQFIEAALAKAEGRS